MINDEKTSGKSYTEISQELSKTSSEAHVDEKVSTREMTNISPQLTKNLFAEIFSFLAEDKLDNVVGVQQFLKSVSNNDSLLEKFLAEWKLEKKFFAFIAEVQQNFKVKYPNLVLDITEMRDQQKESLDQLQKKVVEIVEKKHYAASSIIDAFKQLKNLRKITTEQLSKILERFTFGIKELFEIEKRAFIILANEALLNPVPEVFKVFIRFVCYHASERFFELLLKPEYYYILDRYLSFEEISSRAKAHIQNSMFDGPKIGNNILLIEFIIAFHHNFLLKDQSVQAIYPKSVFPQPPLHNGVVSVHKEVRNVFLPLVKFFEATFYNDNLFSRFLFHNEKRRQISEILNQFSDKFIKEYRNAEGSTLLMLALSKDRMDEAEILVKRCPALSNIADAQQTFPLKLALEKQAPESLIALLKEKNEGKAFQTEEQKSAVVVTEDTSPEEKRTTELSF